MGVKVVWRQNMSAVEFITPNGTRVQAVTSPGSWYGGVTYAFWSEDQQKWWGWGREREIGIDEFMARFEGQEVEFHG